MAFQQKSEQQKAAIKGFQLVEGCASDSGSLQSAGSLEIHFSSALP